MAYATGKGPFYGYCLVVVPEGKTLEETLAPFKGEKWLSWKESQRGVHATREVAWVYCEKLFYALINEEGAWSCFYSRGAKQNQDFSTELEKISRRKWEVGRLRVVEYVMSWNEPIVH